MATRTSTLIAARKGRTHQGGENQDSNQHSHKTNHEALTTPSQLITRRLTQKSSTGLLMAGGMFGNAIPGKHVHSSATRSQHLSG
ncbi:hypothetical protein M0802_015815 [Mischocyttarus mexicanus]|nr:hypothetical protein M0802_015815 [Mischocyttarus mexicanus]